MIGRQSGRKPHVVVHLDIERGFEWVDERCMRMIEVAEVGCIDGRARKECRRKWRKGLSRILEQRRSGVAMAADKVGTEPSRFDDFIRATFTISEFSNSSGRGVAVNLDFSHDKVADSKGDRRAGGIGALAMDGTAFFGKQAEDLFGKLSSGSRETEEGMDVRGLLLGWSRGRRKTEVKRKTKGAADSRNTANDIGTVDRAAVPSVGSSMGGFDKNSVGTTVVGCDCNSFVQKSVKVFNTDGFVIAAGGDMDIDIEDVADFLEETFEGAAVVDDDQAAEADFQKNILDEEASEIVGADIVGGSDEDEAGEITHGIHQICFATVVCDFARSPEIDVEDIEGAAEGPGEDELAVAGDSAVGSDTVRAAENPFGNVFAAMRPKEAEADAMQSLVDSHMTGRGRGMVSREDVATKGRRNDDQHQHLLIVLNGLVNDELAIEEGEAVLADVVTVGVVEDRNILFGEWRRGRETVEKKFSIGVLGISGSPVEGRGNRAGTGGSVDE